MSDQPEALWLADELDCRGTSRPKWQDQLDAASELRRLHGEVAAMNQRADEIHKWYDVLLDRAEQAEAEVERLREAAGQALKALEEIHPGNMTPMAEESWSKAITALKETK